MASHLPRIGFLFVLLSLFSTLQAQTCPDCRYSSYVFDEVDISTVKFGEGPNANGNMQELFMDVYEPHGDTASVRPVVVFAFGGGFIQGSRDEEYMIKACKRFARAGYVAYSIDYRIGFDPLGLFPVPTEELMRTFFRAMQDMRGAVQYTRHHAANLGNTYRLDTNRIFVGGVSAGAITACLTAYCDKASEFAELGNLNAIAGLGGFNSSSGLYPNENWTSHGVINVSGAVVNVNWIEPGDPPIVSAHGDEDLIVPYAGGNFGIGPISIGLEGSYNIHQAAASRGICSYLYTLDGEGHPSGNEPEVWYDEIYNRAMPRAWGVVQGLTFCCSLEVEVVNDQLQVTRGDQAEVEANLIYAGNDAVLKWCDIYDAGDGCGSPFSYTPDSMPTYALAMAVDSGCVATDFVTITEMPVGTPEAQLGQGFSFGPNPVSDQMWVQWRSDGPAPERIALIDLSGKVVKTWDWPSLSSIALKLGEIPGGMYLLEVERKGVRYQERLLHLTSKP